MFNFIKSKEMKISLLPEQEKMLSTKQDIIIIIKENPKTVMAFDIYKDNTLVGFVLVHLFENKKYFLWEYAIDVKYQNQGFGTNALIEFINYLKTNYNAIALTTTYVYGNDHAKHIYEKVGFVETDVVDEPDCHEVNMIYNISSNN